MNYRIRQIEPSDIEAIRTLFLRLLDAAFVEFPAAAKQHYVEQWQESVLATACRDSQRVMLAAFDSDGSPQGYLFGSAVEGGLATIFWLVTAPECRRQGIGRRLLTAAAARYRELGVHKLRLFTHSEVAKQFYQDLGWRCEGIHPDHWWRMHFWSLAYLLDNAEGLQA